MSRVEKIMWTADGSHVRQVSSKKPVSPRGKAKDSPRVKPKAVANKKVPSRQESSKTPVSPRGKAKGSPKKVPTFGMAYRGASITVSPEKATFDPTFEGPLFSHGRLPADGSGDGTNVPSASEPVNESKVGPLAPAAATAATDANVSGKVPAAATAATDTNVWDHVCPE